MRSDAEDKKEMRRGEAKKEGGEEMRRRGKVLGAIHSFIKVGDESLEGQVPNRARQGGGAQQHGSHTHTYLSKLTHTQTMLHLGMCTQIAHYSLK